MKGDESLLDFTACVQSESWYNKQKSGTNGGITPRCNMCNIMHNMVAISYRHPSRVNTETEQKEHTSQPFGSPLSPSSVFCFSGAVLAKQQQSGHASRQSASTLTFSNPPPAQPPWRCCRHAPVCGDSFGLVHMLNPDAMVLRAVLFRQNSWTLFLFNFKYDISETVQWISIFFLHCA